MNILYIYGCMKWSFNMLSNNFLCICLCLYTIVWYYLIFCIFRLNFRFHAKYLNFLCIFHVFCWIFECFLSTFMDICRVSMYFVKIFAWLLSIYNKIYILFMYFTIIFRKLEWKKCMISYVNVWISSCWQWFFE